MHLTEWTRRVQHFKSHTITNQSPFRVKELLNLMMLDFPSKSGKGKPWFPLSIFSLLTKVASLSPMSHRRFVQNGIS